MTVKAVYPEHYDGFRLRQWLLEVRPELDGNVTVELGPSLARHWSDWVVPGRVTGVDVVDQVCIRLGLHLSEVPDSLGCDPPSRAPYVLGKRAEGMELLAAGVCPVDVAARLGVSASLVYRWRREQEQA